MTYHRKYAIIAIFISFVIPINCKSITEEYNYSNDKTSSKRIVTKSVFIVPSNEECPENYGLDILGRCVKLIRYNRAAEWDFMLMKLNSFFGNMENAEENKKYENTEPLKVNIPILPKYEDHRPIEESPKPYLNNYQKSITQRVRKNSKNGNQSKQLKNKNRKKDERKNRIYDPYIGNIGNIASPIIYDHDYNIPRWIQI